MKDKRLSMFDTDLDECDQACVLRLNELAAEGVFVDEDAFRKEWQDKWQQGEQP